MRSCACHLNFLTSQQPRSVTNPTSVRTPAPNELEYLDIFDFFNYPRLPIPIGNGLHRSDSMVNAGDLAPMDDFPLMHFAAPNPDSDWLIFKPPHD